jgi:hypothetical protein
VYWKFLPGLCFYYLRMYVRRCATVSPSVSMTLLPFLTSLHPGCLLLGPRGRAECGLSCPIGDFKPIVPSVDCPRDRRKVDLWVELLWLAVQHKALQVGDIPALHGTERAIRPGIVLFQNLNFIRLANHL